MSKKNDINLDILANADRELIEKLSEIPASDNTAKERIFRKSQQMYNNKTGVKSEDNFPCEVEVRSESGFKVFMAAASVILVVSGGIFGGVLLLRNNEPEVHTEVLSEKNKVTACVSETSTVSGAVVTGTAENRMTQIVSEITGITDKNSSSDNEPQISETKKMQIISDNTAAVTEVSERNETMIGSEINTTVPESVNTETSTSYFTDITSRTEKDDSFEFQNADFEDLLVMDEETFKKYCFEYNYRYVSKDQAEDDLNNHCVVCVMMKPERYLTEGTEDVTVSENLSDLITYNTSDYDFEKMIQAVALPQEYYTVSYDPNFDILFDSEVIEETDERRTFFLKLARLIIQIKPEFKDDKCITRLYQLIYIIPEKCRDFKHISVRYAG